MTARSPTATTHRNYVPLTHVWDRSNSVVLAAQSQSRVTIKNAAQTSRFESLDVSSCLFDDEVFVVEDAHAKLSLLFQAVRGFLVTTPAFTGSFCVTPTANVNACSLGPRQLSTNLLAGPLGPHCLSKCVAYDRCECGMPECAT